MPYIYNKSPLKWCQTSYCLFTLKQEQRFTPEYLKALINMVWTGQQIVKLVTGSFTQMVYLQEQKLSQSHSPSFVLYRKQSGYKSLSPCCALATFGLSERHNSYQQSVASLSKTWAIPNIHFRGLFFFFFTNSAKIQFNSVVFVEILLS